MGDTYRIRYCDSNSILVVNRTGKLRRIYTPFRVVADTPDGKRKWLIVDEVRTGADGGLVYIINRQPFPHSQFRIEIHF